MSLNMYQVSVPMFISMLNNLSRILIKAERYAEKKKIDPTIFVNSRLIADMYPISRQIQIGTDIVRKGIARLADVNCPTFKDDEKTMADLQKRITKTIAFLQKIKPAQMADSETKKIEFSIRDNLFKFNRGDEYLQAWIIPHFYFHMTTTYNILRSNGVNLGKRDFLKF